MNLNGGCGCDEKSYLGYSLKVTLVRITSDWVKCVTVKEISRKTSKFLVCAFTEGGRGGTRKGNSLGLKNKEVCL